MHDLVSQKTVMDSNDQMKIKVLLVDLIPKEF
jgi:hypothetical protein